MNAPTAAVAQAHRDATTTETTAQQRMAPKAGHVRGRVLALVVAAGERGLTATEAYEAYIAEYGVPSGGLYSIAPRLSELERRGEWAQSTGRIRDNRMAYIATPAGIAWAEAQR